MTQIAQVRQQDDPEIRQAAIGKMQRLYAINKRWNLATVSRFILEKQKELCF